MKGTCIGKSTKECFWTEYGAEFKLDECIKGVKELKDLILKNASTLGIGYTEAEIVETNFPEEKKSHLNLYNFREVGKAWDIKCILEELCLQFAEYIFGKIFERIFRFNYNNFLVENIWDSLFNSEEISGLVDKEISIDIYKKFRFLCFFVNTINNINAR